MIKGSIVTDKVEYARAKKTRNKIKSIVFAILFILLIRNKIPIRKNNAEYEMIIRLTPTAVSVIPVMKKQYKSIPNIIGIKGRGLRLKTLNTKNIIEKMKNKQQIGEF